jgi:glycosyltransferase involved in cell wall biosynthesis
LHSGGGIQVAVSFIDELSQMGDLSLSLSILVSDEVHNNLQAIDIDCSRFSSYEVFNTYGLSTLWSNLGNKVRGFDVVFTVFGPLYLWQTQAVSIIGFAQPWIIYPENEIFRSLSLSQKLKTKLKFLAQSLFFRRADRLVVELEHVKSGLLARRFLNGGRIDVVQNCLGAIYFRPEQWKPLTSSLAKNTFSIGFVGRDYPHKNTNILPGIKKALKDEHGLDVDFYVTLNSTEWNAKSDLFRDCINNVGVLDVAQCPSFYEQMDAVIFPSFLECFSATPLEAMAMKKPLFASDRGFVRDVCGDFAWYFDPEDPSAAADRIADYINNQADRVAKLAAAREHVVQFSNARQRAADYLRIMQDAAIGHSAV